MLSAVTSQSCVHLLYPFFLIHLCIKAGEIYLKLIIDRIIAMGFRKVSNRDSQTNRVLNNFDLRIGKLIRSNLRDAHNQALIFAVTYSNNVTC